MLQVARLAPNLLQEAASRVSEFIHDEITQDGGVRDKSGKCDLYYTVFGLEALIALRQEPPAQRVRPYLEQFGDGEGLDFVHLASLARCWAALGKEALPPDRSRRLAERLKGRENGSVYHQFLGVGAAEDLGRAPERPEEAIALVLKHLSEDGSFGGTTPTTAGAVTLLHHLGAPVPPRSGEWLLARARPQGGFLAVPEAPMPDLLSTATALHALSGLHIPVGALKDAMLDFIDTLWTGRAFCGHWGDDVPDCEYTYYALLSLGHLSLA
jgi:hypothetical protein